jgi:hypothetical protein
MAMNTDIPRLVPVIVGKTCIGHLINLGPRGIEAFDRGQSLGIFPDVISAASAVERAVTTGVKGGAG